MKARKIIAVMLIVLTALLSLIVPANAAAQTGDVNGDGQITITDVTLIQKYLSGIKSSEKFYSQYADFDRSGKVDIVDATMIQKYLSGTIAVYDRYLISIENGTGSIYKYFGTASTITVPRCLSGYGCDITAIASNAFYNNNTLTTVTLPETVKTINDYAFNNCSQLKTIYAYNKNLRWGNSFVNCPKFQSIQFK
ncbi:dockerin type I domain-containing protein [Ruminococcus sp.]|uniref:dockerin type I domain-containing protein n=1 Tax=Ruminococcus sp. TaxID=41978 RepID=UPI00260F392C|nr:dockerin type I domain-containing protein [Ruminococcus sp.]MDD6988387.1 dockerin type I domain-containing protein [Ruminococcus sp.]MDY6202549.1 dockerin type I domain-containing protein [Ruminococcus sp.]